MSKKRSPIWRFFEDCPLDPKHAKCKLCNEKISRGSDIPSKRTTKLLDAHLEKYHSKEYSGVKVQKSKSSSMNNGSDEPQPGTSSMNGSIGNGDTKISNLKSRAERSAAMSATITDWVESKTKVGFHSEKGQAFHKSIFEMLIMDSQPFSNVNDLGFQRHHQLFLPNYEVWQKKYSSTWKIFNMYFALDRF